MRTRWTFAFTWPRMTVSRSFQALLRRTATPRASLFWRGRRTCWRRQDGLRRTKTRSCDAANTSKPHRFWRWQAVTLHNIRRPQRGQDPALGGSARCPTGNPPQGDCKKRQEDPSNATHWRPLGHAEAVGFRRRAFGRIWSEVLVSSRIWDARLQVSNDPMFEEKVTDIVGLYLDPPERAGLVLCVDEKVAKIQALDRNPAGDCRFKKGAAAR